MCTSLLMSTLVHLNYFEPKQKKIDDFLYIRCSHLVHCGSLDLYIKFSS